MPTSTQTHCVKSVRIWSFSGPYFSALGLNKEPEKLQITDIFYAVTVKLLFGRDNLVKVQRAVYIPKYLTKFTLMKFDEIKL